MLIATAFAADYFKETLHTTDEGRAVGLSYFRERGFSDATIERFELGFCPTAGDAFTTRALKEGFQEQYLIDTGLSIKREDGTWYDRFTGRVIFPIHSVSGRVIAFGGRTLRTDKKTAKYVNSPESEIYHKSGVLYGLHQAKRAIGQEDYCILVEGYTDVISLHQSGVENVVASSGTSLTEGQIKLIARFSRNVTVIYDGDPAGIRASLRGIDMILREGMNVRVVLLPEGEDPDSFARAHSATQLKEYIAEHQQDFISFKADLLMSEASSDPIKRAALITDLVDSIAVIPDAIARNVYIKECSLRMHIDESVLLDEVARRRRDQTFGQQEREFLRRREQHEKNVEQPPVIRESDPGRIRLAGSGFDELERELIAYLLRYGCREVEFDRDGRKQTVTVAAAILGELQADGIEPDNPDYRAIYREYLLIQEENPAHTPESFPMNRLTNYPDGSVCNRVVDLLVQGDTHRVSRMWEEKDIAIKKEEDVLKTAVPRTIALYKSKIIEQMIDSLKRELAELNEPSDRERRDDILARLKRLNTLRKEVCSRFSRILL
jgi:DNA primase